MYVSAVTDFLFTHGENLTVVLHFAVNGDAVHVDFIHSSVTKREDEDVGMDGAPLLVPVFLGLVR